MDQARNIESGNELIPAEALFLDKLRELSATAEKRMQETHELSGSEWVRTYMDRVTIISITVELFFRAHGDLRKKYTSVLERTTKLVKKAKQANADYGETDPPDEIKKELMRELNVLE